MNKPLAESSFALMRIYPIVRMMIYRAFDLHEVDLTRTQQNILLAMSSFEKLHPSELADFIDITREQTTRSVTELADLGYISIIGNKRNKRTKDIMLTETADELINDVYRLVAQMFEKRYSDLAPIECRTLMENLTSAARVMEKVDLKPYGYD